jgi:hypothetical protein
MVNFDYSALARWCTYAWVGIIYSVASDDNPRGRVAKGSMTVCSWVGVGMGLYIARVG